MPVTEVIEIDTENIKLADIKRAAGILKSGGLVAFPTETVYGLGADMGNELAVNRLYEVKNRPKDKPFTVAVSDLAQVKDMGCEISPHVFRLADRFWPGPLTIILGTREGITMGFRMPDCNIALAIIEEMEDPLALPSANISGRPAPTTAQEVMDGLNGKIDLVLDGGKTRLGIESTVLDLTVSPYKILRKGAVSEEEIKKIPEKSVLFLCTGNSCRSVMAEAFLKKYLESESTNSIEAVSAGIAGLEGFSPTEETIKVMEEEGIDVKGFKSKALSLSLINKADLILVMEEIHKKEVLRRLPSAKNKVHLLREFAGDENREDGFGMQVPDPITKPIEVYKNVRGIIKRNVKKLLEKL